MKVPLEEFVADMERLDMAWYPPESRRNEELARDWSLLDEEIHVLGEHSGEEFQELIAIAEKYGYREVGRLIVYFDMKDNPIGVGQDMVRD